jgi:hypothetical protein
LITTIRLRRLIAGLVAIATVSLSMPATLLAQDGVPEEPPSFGNAALYHMTFAGDIDLGSYLPVSNGDRFPIGSPYILSLVGWQVAPAGTELRLRLFKDDRLVYEDARIVQRPRNSGYVFAYVPPGGAEEGRYTAQLEYNRVPEEFGTFDVVPADQIGDPPQPTTPGASPLPSPDMSPLSPSPAAAVAPVVSESPGASPSAGASPGPGTDPGTPPPAAPTGPIPYASPPDVLVVTRSAALREKLGAQADAVFAAAALVGDVHDLEADGVPRATPELAIAEVQRLLRARQYRYLLILGNDDVVPFARVANPMAADEARVLQGWQLPAEWLPSDDPYTDLDADQYQLPELPTARIPSSDDAALLLTQLGETTPPDAGSYAYLNQAWRAHSGVVVETMDDFGPVSTGYAPPLDAPRIAASEDDNGRYAYISMHGIGAETDQFWFDEYAWRAYDPANLAGEWEVLAAEQKLSMDISNAHSRGVVKIGTCYGGWTLDTVRGDQHKSADNNIALSYLKSGARAIVGETHISYAAPIGVRGPYIGASGYEILFFRYLLQGNAPIDAFFRAKLDVAEVMKAAIAQGQVEIASINLKTVHEEVYFGRP